MTDHKHSSPLIGRDNVAQTKQIKSRFVTAIVHTCVWGYLLLLLSACLLIRFEGERWWFATLVLFGPRWIFGLPLLLLLPMTLLTRRRLIWIVLCSACVFTFALLNFSIPWRTWALPPANGQTLRLMTCNTHRRFLNATALSQAIDDAKPDLVVLQEWTSDQSRAIFHGDRWQFHLDGDMLLASKYPISGAYHVLPAHSGLEGAVVSYDISLPTATIRLINLHLASPHLVFADALRRKPDAPDEIADNCFARRIESDLIARDAKSTLMPTFLAGDFNTPIDSETFTKSWDGFTDAFSFAGTGVGVTYRVKWTHTRIDHILFNRNWKCCRCWLGPDVGSPHLPVIADLQRVP